MANTNSASPEIIWGLGGPEEDPQLHHIFWTGRVGEREEERRRSCDNVYKINQTSDGCDVVLKGLFRERNSK